MVLHYEPLSGRSQSRGGRAVGRKGEYLELIEGDARAFSLLRRACNTASISMDGTTSRVGGGSEFRFSVFLRTLQIRAGGVTAQGV